MEKNENEHLNLFIDKAFKDLELEKAPTGLSNSIMSKIRESSAKDTPIIYKPIISNYSWVIIACFSVLILTIDGLESTFYVDDESMLNYRYPFFENLQQLDSFMQQLRVSKDTIYAFIGLLFFVIIQMSYLKKLFSQRNVAV